MSTAGEYLDLAGNAIRKANLWLTVAYYYKEAGKCQLDGNSDKAKSYLNRALKLHSYLDRYTELLQNMSM